MILLIDNYDSFVFNLARYFQRMGLDTSVVRNDAISVAQVRELEPAAVVLSPGPCTPAEAGVSLQLVRDLCSEVPIFGVCLGHQTIGAAFGARIVPTTPVHGRASSVIHAGAGPLSLLPSPFLAGRYHSLAIDPSTVPECLQVTATTEEGVIMAVQHRAAPVMGVQFHPESVLTDVGYLLLAGMLRWAGVELPAQPLPGIEQELIQPVAPRYGLPVRPVTF